MDSNDTTAVLDSEPEPTVTAIATPAATDANAGRAPTGGIVLAASLGGMIVLVAAISAVVLLRAKKG